MAREGRDQRREMVRKVRGAPVPPRQAHTVKARDPKRNRRKARQELKNHLGSFFILYTSLR